MSSIQQVLAATKASAGGGDPNFANVASLLHFDGADASTTFTDQIGITWTAVGNAQLDTAQSKFGTASLLLDGTGDYASAPNSPAWDIGSNNYTAECFIRPATVASLRMVVARRELSSDARGWFMYIGADGSINFAGYSLPNVVCIALSSAASVVAVNTWAHVAIVRNAGVWDLYYEGNSVASDTESAVIGANARPLLIGRQASNTSRDFNGHIDEFRITDGVARYTANFTPPTVAFPDN